MNHVWPGLGHLLSQARKALRLSRRSPSINPDRFALDVAEPRQFIEECAIALVQARLLDITSTGLDGCTIARSGNLRCWAAAPIGSDAAPAIAAKTSRLLTRSPRRRGREA